MFRIVIFISLLWSSFSYAAHGDMPKAQQIAMQYMQALTSHNYQALQQFYARDAVFIDRTAGREYHGNRHIIEFLKRAHRGVLEYKFTLEHMYNSGSLVVMIGNYHLRGPGEQFGKPGKIIEIAVAGVTTLKLDLDKHRVKEHLDLIDYQTMVDQLSAQ